MHTLTTSGVAAKQYGASICVYDFIQNRTEPNFNFGWTAVAERRLVFIEYIPLAIIVNEIPRYGKLSFGCLGIGIRNLIMRFMVFERAAVIESHQPPITEI